MLFFVLFLAVLACWFDVQVFVGGSVRFPFVAVGAYRCSGCCLLLVLLPVGGACWLLCVPSVVEVVVVVVVVVIVVVVVA